MTIIIQASYNFATGHLSLLLDNKEIIDLDNDQANEFCARKFPSITIDSLEYLIGVSYP